jgi:hypothetical protein
MTVSVFVFVFRYLVNATGTPGVTAQQAQRGKPTPAHGTVAF